MKTILLLEDDENLNRGISLKLSNEGYQVLSAFSIEEAEVFWKKEEVHMVISDITLPDGSGLDFGKRVREKSDVYLLYLTALDQEIDIVNGYDTGADDYITKPFSVNILTSKVNALMRRLGEKEGAVLYSGDIEVSIRELQIKKAGEEISLSKTEIQLLVYLLENAGQIVSKENILEKIWGVDGQFVDDNTVTVNISRLKNKLETDCISNVRGLGYVWTGKVVRK
ncbi:MAG: response regulator transcription factor [Lachnospiraceae bacterium]|nr:response regulator transcription factor [Lachnospiraceae bacterium]